MDIQDRPLSQIERRKLHPNEVEVVQAYERITKNTFMRFELVLLKRLIRIATPAQIIAIIYKMQKNYADNFVDFLYVVKPVEQIFKNRRGGKK